MLLILSKIFRFLSRISLKIKYYNLITKYNLKSYSNLRGKDIELYGNGKIVFGNGSYIGNRSSIQSEEGFSVVVGANVAIAHNVRIYTKSRKGQSVIDPEQPLEYKCGNVIISDHCWIGANVLINPGVVIGRNVVVGANSVVTKNLESFTVYGGVPAKKLYSKFHPI
jgi:maltose O-acetyltransferase